MPDPYSISSQTIKKLTIYYDCEYGSDFMSFDGPSLVSLDCSDYALYVYPLVNLESLVEAKLVDLCYSKRIKRPDISGLLVGISNVQTLHLSVGSVDNLVSLSFGSNHKRCWKLLPYLLKQSPKVETIVIKGRDGDTCDDTIASEGTAKEFEHLKSLLGATKCNEKVRVEFHENVWWMWMMTLLLKPVGI
ncbi:hypothetical protein BRARA_I04136 [Brassica rapa]|uniref:FBD domain-containing protein n=1 Tax=Brassica campestris TaxID=3711 RepID=A0A397Y9A9_BRACM|nr:hypothetical protein BRARA_I04136 [Brassica rapa]